MSTVTTNLPIDVIPGTIPPRFRWRQAVTTPIGPTTIEHEGHLMPSIENAVASLIGIAKRLVDENTRLHERLKKECALNAKHHKEQAK